MYIVHMVTWTKIKPNCTHLFKTMKIGLAFYNRKANFVNNVIKHIHTHCDKQCGQVDDLVLI